MDFCANVQQIYYKMVFADIVGAHKIQFATIGNIII